MRPATRSKPPRWGPSPRPDVPEGHTIHRLARDLNRTFRGEQVEASSPQGRFADGAARLAGQTCIEFEAWGKHLFGTFDGGDVLHVHLGLIGKFRKVKGAPVGAVRLRLTADDVNWDLRGPMVCDLGGPELIEGVAAKLGPDPLRSDGDVEEFIARVRRRRIAIGAALLDQAIIAGIGNVYRAEFLFMAGLDPRTPANRVDETDLRLIWKLAEEHLANGVKLNRIVTVHPHDVGHPTLRSVPRDERLYVYKRQGAPCRTCATPIEEFEVGARLMWECPTCQ